MSNLFRFIRAIKIKQVLSVFIAGSLLIISTACSNGNVAQAGGREYTENAKRAMSDTYDKYDADQEFKGGINGYNDDRRYDNEVAAKTKALVDQAERRKADSLGEYVENVTDRASDRIETAQKEVPSKVKKNLAAAKKDIDKRTDKLQENLSKVPDGAKEVLEGAAETAEDAVEDATRATAKTTNKIKNNLKDLT